MGGVFGQIARMVNPDLGSLGSFGADFDINLSSNLSIDRSGNIEARNSSSSFRIVPGSESGGLLEGDRWNRQVVEGINEGFAGALSQVIKIPVKDMTDSMLGFPVKATGAIDSGPGFFGICFTPDRRAP